MKTQNLDEARSLLSNDSRRLALEMASEHKLQQAPESLALLNALDPTAAPVVMKSEETSALLQLRTLKGGLRLIRLIRKDSQFSLEDRLGRGTTVASIFSRSARDSGYDPRAGG